MVRCVMTDRYSNKVTSKAATIILSELGITSQTTAITGAASTTQTASVVATGIDNTYQWQLSKDGGKTWSNTTVTGAKTDTISLKLTATYNGYYVRCVITESTGNKITSDAIKITVQ